MRIKSIEAKNFKSLVDFRIELTQLNCLIGLNGSGKSTVLQFIDFLSQLVIGDMKGWLKERKWAASDLKSKLTTRKNIDLCVDFDEGGIIIGYWKAVYNPSKNYCTHEHFALYETSLEVKAGDIHICDPDKDINTRSPVAFDYEGSIVSAYKEELLPPPILEIKKLIKAISSLELLSPEYLRQRTRESSGSLGLGGQKLTAFLHELGPEKRYEMANQLTAVYPQLQQLQTTSLKSGWKQIEIVEKYKGQDKKDHSFFFPKMTTEARHINDGMLRLIAIIAELKSDHRFLLFDEIENGINPELVEFVITLLTSTYKQVLVTTHSPMILNYLSDEMAKAGVIYLYKTPEGLTKAIPFFLIPSMAEKLTVMGPGEVFVDTNLKELEIEIQGINTEDQ